MGGIFDALGCRPTYWLLARCALLAPCRCPAQSIIFNCTYAEVLTGTNGVVQRYSIRRTVRVGNDAYQVWSYPHGEWGENQCNLGRCLFNDKTFSYESSELNNYDGGYITENKEELTIDRATGRLTAEKKTNTTTPLTRYEAETTWYDSGTCIRATDRAGSTRKATEHASFQRSTSPVIRPACARNEEPILVKQQEGGPQAEIDRTAGCALYRR